MDISAESYREVVKHVGSRTDLAALSRVSRAFRTAAERALYNTLYMYDVEDTMHLCDTLARQPRVASLVDAFTVHVGDLQDEDSDTEADHSHDEITPDLPSQYWPSISLALRHLTRLRHLNIYVGQAALSAATAWILDGCSFQLHSFHCDLDWDDHLVAFLNTQRELDDLYIVDYRTPANAAASSTASTMTTMPLLSTAMPRLSTLECTFIEAATAIAAERPVVRLKTCFSQPNLGERREELMSLSTALAQRTTRIRALDVGDSAYVGSFSINVLAEAIKAAKTLRYLGTLALPVDGQEVRFRYWLRPTPPLSR